MGFNPFTITTQGAILASKTLIGEQLRFTRFKAGDGDAPEDARILNDLISPIMDFAITSILRTSNIQVTIKGLLKNVNAPQNFYWKELGLYAEDPDTLEEILFAYSNYGDNPEYVVNSIAQPIDRYIQQIITVDNADNVIIEINPDTVYVTHQELDNEMNRIITKGGLVTYDNVPINELQKLIDSLPICLNHDVAINVNPGTVNGNMTIQDFFGPGEIIIRGNTGQTIPVNTHNMNLFSIQTCSNKRIQIDGFNFTRDSANRIDYCNAHINIAFNSFTAGDPAGTNYGIQAQYSPNVRLNSNLISNKRIGVLSRNYSRVTMINPSGENNYYAYSAQESGEISLQSAGNMGYTYSEIYRTTGGILVRPSGSIIGT